MGSFKEPRVCPHCETYKTRDRTSLIRHEDVCLRRQQNGANIRKAGYPSPSQSVSGSDGTNSSPPGLCPSPLQTQSAAYPSGKSRAVPSFTFPRATFNNSTASSPFSSFISKRSTVLVPGSKSSAAGGSDYELRALQSRVDELEKELASFSVMQSQWRTLEAKVRTLESWVCQ